MFEDLKINISGGLSIPMPQMAAVRQHFPSKGLNQIPTIVRQTLQSVRHKTQIQPEANIAIGVGSRGIANTVEIVRAMIAELKAWGAKPFVFPAMGSHGGATAEGQKHLLARYGVTEQNIGAPVRATMDAIQVTQMPDGTPLFVDRFALESDGIVLLNRVKPHTTVRGAYQSGIIKMLIIGMGKIRGATVMHSDHGMDRFHTVLPHAAQCLLPHIPFSFGLALVEDAFDQTAHIEAIFPDQLLGREKALLTMATERMARLHFDEIDVLVIDQIGKEISGAGFDPNVAGRNSRGVNGFDHPKIDKLVLLDLTDMTHGNATGVGMADVITQQLFNRIDFAATYANVITSAYLDGAAIPIVMPNSEDAVRLAVKTVLRVKPENTRIVRIKNTLALTEIFVSTPLLEAVSHHSMLEQTSAPFSMQWTPQEFPIGSEEK